MVTAKCCSVKFSVLDFAVLYTVCDVCSGSAYIHTEVFHITGESAGREKKTALVKKKSTTFICNVKHFSHVTKTVIIMYSHECD